MTYMTRRMDAPDRSISDVGPGDYVKIGSRWEKIASNSATGKQRLDWKTETVRTESGGAHGMMGINRYAKAEDMESH
jgi:hypothetical protein